MNATTALQFTKFIWSTSNYSALECRELESSVLGYSAFDCGGTHNYFYVGLLAVNLTTMHSAEVHLKVVNLNVVHLIEVHFTAVHLTIVPLTKVYLTAKSILL